jgi:autotransporter-associated beta strand protein
MYSTFDHHALNRIALGLGLALGSATMACAAPITWIGDGVDRNWSVGANWSGGVPDPSNDVTFTTVGSVSDNTTITSIVDGNTTISAIRFSNTSGNGTDTQQNLQIDNGVTLTVSGSFIVGENSTSNATRVSIFGDTLSVGGEIRVGGSTGGSSVRGPAVLDLSGLNTLNKTGTANVFIGSSPTTGSGAPVIPPHLILAGNSSITATTLRIGGTPIDGTNTLSLGSTSNVINTGTFEVGGGGGSGNGRTSGLVNFYTSTGTLRIRGLAGTEDSRAALNIVRDGNTGTPMSGTMDLLGHDVDLKFSDMVMNTSNANTAHTNTATFSFDQGIIDAESLLVSHISGAGTANRQANSTLNFNGGTLTVSGNVTMAQNNSTADVARNAVATMNIAGSAVNVGGGISIAGKGVGAGASTVASGTLNITAGSLTVGGDIIDGGFVGSGGNATTTLTLDGGTLDLGGNNIGGAVPIDNLNLRAGTLRNVGQINDGGAVSKTTAGTLIIEGVNTWTGPTSVDAGTLLVNGSITSAVTVADGATLGGTGQLGGLSLASGTSFYVADLLNPVEVGGTVDIAAGFGVADLAGLSWESVLDGTYTLIDGTLGVGVFDGLANNSAATAYDIGDGRSAYFREGSLQLVVVPEPSALLLMGIGTLGFVIYRRRRDR